MHYKAIRILASEDARCGGKPLHEAIVERVRGEKIAARCIVARGIGGCYENGEIATLKLEILSFNMPVSVEIWLPAVECERILPAIQEMVADGIVSVGDLQVVSHRTEKLLIPRHLRVRDVMTPSPRKAFATTPAGEVLRMLLACEFNSAPVVDEANKPIGIITQGDLIARGGMPVRLGLMEPLGAEAFEAVLAAMAGKTARDIMTQPVIAIAEDKRLSEAVDAMLRHGLKRMPVVDSAGRLTGMLARLDIFRTIATESPDWGAIGARNVVVSGIRHIKDIMRRDIHTVKAGASLEEIMKVIDYNDIQRVAVVDETGKLIGLIFDRDLLRLFSKHKAGLWDRIASKFTFSELGRRHKAVVDQAAMKTAGDLMQTEIVTAREDATIDEAIRVMTERHIKRLPVVDAEGRFQGMVSRDSLLRVIMDGYQTER